MAVNIFKWLIPEPFPDELEIAYQNYLHHRLFRQIKISISAGVIVALIYIVLDIIDSDVAPSLWKVRLTVLSLPVALVGYMEIKPAHATRWLDVVIVAMAAYTLIGMLAIFFTLLKGNIEHGVDTDFAFVETTPSNALVIIFVFGPLATPLKPAIVLCVADVALVLLGGVYFGVSDFIKLDSLFDLSAVVFMGSLFRRQFEIFSRQEYIGVQQAEARRHEAEALARERIRFIRDASHNLRQPLQAIVAHNEALAMKLDRVDHGDCDLAATADSLFASVNELRESFNKVMRLSSLHDGRISINITSISVAETLRAAEAIYFPAASAKGISLIVRHVQANIWASSDAGLLSSILGNLLDNAIKYTPRGKVLVRAAKINDRIHIHVLDTGIGIKEKDKDNIFKDFHRLENGLGIGGMGIGLSYVKNALDCLEGHDLCWVSREDHGTHFRLSLPAASPMESKNPEGSPIAGERVGSGKMILWVDDELKVLNALSQAVSLYGYEIAKASCVTEARLELEGHSDMPDIVITDYKLRDETAEDVVRCVHDLCGPIPIVVLSGEIKANETISLLGQEFTLLQKPVTPAHLVQVVMRLTG